jgi:hypothetical protein
MRDRGQACAVKTDGRLGKVVAVEGERAVVEFRADAACGRGLGCVGCSLFRADSFTARLPRGDLQEGDTVRVTVPTGASYLSILLVFVLPILLAVVGFVGGSLLEPQAIEGWGGILGGLGGLVLAVTVAVLANRRLGGISRLHVERVTEG